MIMITGASGQLGRLVIEALLKKVPSARIAAAVRDPGKVKDLAGRGVAVRRADYDKPETLAEAFEGVDKLLLISSSEVGRRLPQHEAVIGAAKAAGVSLIAYTSILRASDTPLGLGEEHRGTEAAIKASGLPFVLLRNGWYTENYAAGIPAILANGAMYGCAGEGRISSAARADYAQAAAEVLTREGQEGRVFELAGDASYSLSEFAAEIARQSGKAIVYRDLPRDDYKAALAKAGLPGPIAGLLADSDAGAAKGGLFDDGKALSGLIGRPTTPFADTVKAALQNLAS